MKLFKTLLVAGLLLAVLALACWAATLYLGWPLWRAAAMFAGVIGLYLLCRLLRRLWVVLSAHNEMERSARLRQLRDDAGSPQALLAQRWKAAAHRLRRSGLRRHGNPLDVLPWYLMIGRSGTGKTTALTRSRLATPLQQVDQNAPIEQTANCDWWYFDDAVVVDCAGRYVEAEATQQDRDEWEVVLQQLHRLRARAGLNGLVIAIDARRLQQPDPDALNAEGRVLRQRIEQLIQLFGKRFPIYLLVTQCDHVYGWEDWAGLLPPQALAQAMGCLAECEEPQLLERAFDGLESRLAAMRLTLAQAPGAATPAMLMFPGELARLKPGLRIFLDACFREHAYLEQPFLRGLFFSSGLQGGGAASQLLPGVLAPEPTHAASHQGGFLHDFFGHVLPRDSDARLPTAISRPWRSARRHPLLIGWVAACAGLAGVLLLAVQQNRETVRLVQTIYPLSPTFSGTLDADARTLEGISDALSVVEARNNAWDGKWLADRGPVGALERRLRQSFAADYQQHVEPGSYRLFQETAKGSQASAHALQAGRIHNIVRYIHLIRARLDGAERHELALLPEVVPIDPDSSRSPQLLRRLNRLDVSFIAWSSDQDGFLVNRMAEAQGLLEQQAYGAEPVFAWLLQMPMVSMATDDLTLASFWLPLSRDSALQPAAQALADTRVAAAFTAEGKHAIDRFLDDMALAVADRDRFAQARHRFEGWYRQRRLNAWQQFATSFPQGDRLLEGEAPWRAALVRAADVRDPYALLIDRLAHEFKAEPETALPRWLLLARTLSRLQSDARAGALLAGTKAAEVLGTVNGVGGRALRQVAQDPPQARDTLRRDFALRTQLVQFRAQLDAAMREMLDGAGKAYPLAADFHALGIDPEVKASSLRAAATAMQALRQGSGYDQPDNALVWNLVGGPLHLMLSYADQQASCTLQKAWESDVLWPLQSATSMAQIVEQLFGSQGSVWAFADGPAKPFLRREASQFSLVQTLNYSLPVTPAFLPMLNGAVNKRVEQLVKQQQIEAARRKQETALEKNQVDAELALKNAESALAQADKEIEALRTASVSLAITGQPTDVNPQARARPFQTTLTLQCASGTRVLNNYNFPATERLAWSLAQCGEASLQIRIEDLVLTRLYPGPQGIVDFVEQFRTGAHAFGPMDFPASRERLAALQVSQIQVRYDMEGQQELLQTAGRRAELLRQRAALAAQRQQLQARQASDAQALVEIRAPGAQGEPLLTVSMPPRIGACWSSDSRSRSPQTLQAMFKALVDAPAQEAPPSAGPAASAAANPAASPAASPAP